MPALLEVSNISAAYDGVPVINTAGFELKAGDIGCLLGPSGCGKTTLLRAIAGFEPIQSGHILLAGEVISRPGWVLAPERRRVGMVFQDFALFPHLNVSENIAFGLRHQSAAQRRERVQELLALIGLPGQGEVYPHQLSGGQQQRIALARAIAPRPAVLLMDEPFSSMDVDLREQLAREVRGILKQEGVSAVLVTHDQFEAFAMADEIGVVHEGRILQWGKGYQLYHRPADRFVADFIGQGVLLPGTVLNSGQVETGLGIMAGAVREGLSRGSAVDVLVRPDDIIHDDASGLTALVESRVFRGAQFLYTLRLNSGARVMCLASSHHDHAVGERIGIRVEIEHLVMFPRQV